MVEITIAFNIKLYRYKTIDFRSQNFKTEEASITVPRDWLSDSLNVVSGRSWNITSLDNCLKQWTQPNESKERM